MHFCEFHLVTCGLIGIVSGRVDMDRYIPRYIIHNELIILTQGPGRSQHSNDSGH